MILHYLQAEQTQLPAELASVVAMIPGRRDAIIAAAVIVAVTEYPRFPSCDKGPGTKRTLAREEVKEVTGGKGGNGR